MTLTPSFPHLFKQHDCCRILGLVPFENYLQAQEAVEEQPSYEWQEDEEQGAEAPVQVQIL